MRGRRAGATLAPPSPEAATSAVDHFHAHVSFGPDERPAAVALRAALLARFGPAVRAFPPVLAPVRPHPLPMSEAHLRAADGVAVVAGLAAERGARTVLVRPVQREELVAHTTGARWLEDPLPLRPEAP